MSDWKRAGTVQFGSGVRCREMTAATGEKFTVYCEMADCEAVDSYYASSNRTVTEVEPEQIGMVGDGEPEQIVDLPTKTFAPDVLQAMIEESKEEVREDFKSKIQTLLGKK